MVIFLSEFSSKIMSMFRIMCNASACQVAALGANSEVNSVVIFFSEFLKKRGLICVFLPAAVTRWR